MIDQERILALIAEVRISLKRLHGLAALSRKEFSADPDCFAVAEHHLRRSLEMILDMGRHIIAKQGLGRPANYTRIFEILTSAGVLPQEYLEKNRGLPGYRNRLVHIYQDVSAQELHDMITTHLPDLEEFCRHILVYLEAERERPGPDQGREF